MPPEDYEDYEDMSGYEDDASVGGYHPQLGTRVVFNADGFYDQNEAPFDTSISYLVLEPPHQVWRMFKQLDDGGFMPCWHRRDPSIPLQQERAGLGDTDQNAWPVSKFTKTRMDPWVLCYIMYLMDPRTLEIFTFQSHTTGGAIAIREYKAMVVRRNKQIPARRGELPVVTCSVVPFKTRYNMRQRPSFTLVGYGRDPSTPDSSQQIAGPEAPKLISGQVTPPNGNAKLDEFAAAPPGDGGLKPKAAKAKAPPAAPSNLDPEDALADLLGDEVPY